MPLYGFAVASNPSMKVFFKFISVSCRIESGNIVSHFMFSIDGLLNSCLFFALDN